MPFIGSHKQLEGVIYSNRLGNTSVIHSKIAKNLGISFDNTLKFTEPVKEICINIGFCSIV